MGKIISNGIEYVGLTNINGVYIDTNNVIISLTEYKPSMTYTAAEDCYVVLYTVFGSNTTIYINSEIVGNFDGSGNFGITNNFYLKKGQTISVANASSSYNSYYIVYGVQQGSTSQGSSGGIDYSTTEQKTGQKWIDGKDIYQTTIHITSGLTTGDNNYAHNISNIGQVINFEAYRFSSSGGASQARTYGRDNSHNYTLDVQSVDNTNIFVWLGSNYPTSSFNIYITIQYTKSTT